MTSIIKKALASMESMEVKVDLNTAAPAVEPLPTDKPITPVSKPVEETTIALDGPLSNVYFKALNIAYAKPDPVTGVLSTESQQMDYYMAAEAQKKISETEVAVKTEDVVSPNTNNVRLKASVTKDEIIPIVKELVMPSSPGDYCIVFDTMAPTPYSPMGSSNDVKAVYMDKVQPISLEDIESVTILVTMKKR